jgi:hypothetical protein
LRRATPKSTLRVLYRERQQTDEGGALDDLSDDVAEGLDPAADRSLVPESGINRPGSGDRSVDRRLTASYRAQFYRTGVELFGFWREREELAPTADPVIGLQGANIDESYGAGIDLSWSFGARTSLTLQGSWTERTFNTQEADGGTSSELLRGNVRLRYELGRFTEIDVVVGYQTQSGTSEFDETHAAFGLRRYFGTSRGERTNTMPAP